MAIATYEQLRASAGTVTEGRLKLAKSMSSKNLFLSHSHRDEDHVGPALGLLESHGANVYVDQQDAGIKGLSKVEVAGRVRKAVEACGRLAVLVTEQTCTSRWIPWEMGLADGLSGSERVALLPLRPSISASELWIDQEYFDLYWRIEWVKLVAEPSPCWAARNPANGKYRRLEKWMRTSAPTGY